MKRIITSILALVFSAQLFAQNDFDRQRVPHPVFEENPDFVELYYKAWEIAWAHVKHQDGIYQSPYMDEALWDDTIWIWDTAFMVMFCRYAPDTFPGIESLQNFYHSILNKEPSALRIQHPDNPPLYAWVESDYFRFTNDTAHLNKLMKEDCFLTRHYEWFDTLKRGTKLHFKHSWIGLEKSGIGYRWSWTPSGMDNTPRGRGRKSELLWVDALAQQALAASRIEELARMVGDKRTASLYKQRFEYNKKLLNDHYWDPEDGFYYDLDEQDSTFVKVKTPAVYWCMLAGVADKQQAEQLARYAADPRVFGGEYPYPSVSRDDEQYNHEIGDYWRGGVWLPLAYMTTKALEKYGYHDLAAENAYKLISHMSETYKTFSPHTIWECYSPSQPQPSFRQRGSEREIVRPDFCGWSALGPISMFIENVLGFYEVDAAENVVKWNKSRPGKYGIERLRFGQITTDIVSDDTTLCVTSDKPYKLIVNGKTYRIKSGNQSFKFHR